MPAKGSGRSPECHPGEPHFAKGLCKKCYSREYENARKRTPERRKIAIRWAKENKRRVLNSSLKYRYGIGLDEYEAMLLAQNNKCKICSKDDQKLHIDHSHSTGKIRSLLCGPCNRAIGLLGENIRTLESAIEYLKGWSPEHNFDLVRKNTGEW